MNAKPITRQILESEELDLGFLRRYEDTTADDYKLVTALKINYEGKGVFRKMFERNTVVIKSYNNLVSDFYLINMSGEHKASELGIIIGRCIEVLDSIFSLELDVEGEFTKDLFVSGSIVKLDRFDLVSDETFIWYSSSLEITQNKSRRPGISSFYYKVFGYSSLSISSEVKEESKNTFNIELKGDNVIIDLNFTNLPNSSIVIKGEVHERLKNCEIKITHPDPSRISIRDVNFDKNKIEINGQRKVIQNTSRE